MHLHIDAQTAYSVIRGLLLLITTYIVGLLRQSPLKTALQQDLAWLTLHLTPEVVKKALNDVSDPAQAVIDAAAFIGITVTRTTAEAFVDTCERLYRRKI